MKLVFSYVVKGIKIKITAKFRASRRLSFEDTKRIMSPEMRPKSLGTFEKQAPGRDVQGNSSFEILSSARAYVHINYEQTLTGKFPFECHVCGGKKSVEP